MDTAHQSRELRSRVLAATILVGLLLIAPGWLAVKAIGRRLLDDALFEAVERRDLPAVQTLLVRGANANARPSGLAGGTPLMWAAGVNDTRIMSILLQAGADVNADEGGITALMTAQTPEATLLLIRHGANLNAKGRFGETALSLARRSGRTRCSEF